MMIKMKKLSVIIPVYNEEKTVEKVLDYICGKKFPLELEILVVNDGSYDSSEEIVKNFIKRYKAKSKKIKVKLFSKKNEGKGSAVRLGIKMARGNIIIIQDADLEYNPDDYNKIIKPIIDGKEKVVYGSRFLKEHKPLYRIYYLGNKFLTLLTKIIYGTNITDMETCYKAFRSDVIKSIEIKSNKFDIEPEITAKILKRGIRIKEIPISYTPRSVKEGKKIGWRDGLKAIYTLVYWRFRD